MHAKLFQRRATAPDAHPKRCTQPDSAASVGTAPVFSAKHLHPGVLKTCYTRSLRRPAGTPSTIAGEQSGIESEHGRSSRGLHFGTMCHSCETDLEMPQMRQMRQTRKPAWASELARTNEDCSQLTGSSGFVFRNKLLGAPS